jgi:hypothetical protein
VNGFGSFFGNQTGDGLFIDSGGSITLNRVVAGSNGNGGDYGIQLWSEANITLVCSNSFGNAGAGLFAIASGNLTLKGLLSYGNSGLDDLTYGGTFSQTACP